MMSPSKDSGQRSGDPRSSAELTARKPFDRLRARKRRPSDRLGARGVLSTIAIYAVLVLGAVIIVGPFLLSFSTALKTPRQF
jgi:hypothetical protein